jgi:hypothetical protein
MTEPILLPSGASVSLASPGPPQIALPPAGPTAVIIVPVPGVPGIQGPSGANAPVTGETPSGAVDGANTSFGTAQTFVADSTAVYVNGLREWLGRDYTETASNTITLTAPLLAGDTIRIDYLVQA